MIDLDYDMPLYRPPSEGDNLIIQATLGCSYNRCSFCNMYTSKDYRARPLDEVYADIDAAAAGWPTAHRVFLADGDALTLPAGHLLDIVARLRARLPELQRVTAYATPANILKKTPEELAALRAAGLSMVYVGVESGDPDVLKRIAKGASAGGIAKAIDKAMAAGIRVSATVILGAGGADRWREHIDGTAAVINAAPPTFLSTLQLFLDPDAAPGFLDRWGGAFRFQDDAAILAEQERLIGALDPPRPIIFRSNHASNALALAGNLPRDRDRLLARIGAVRAGGPGLRPRFLRGL